MVFQRNNLLTLSTVLLLYLTGINNNNNNNNNDNNNDKSLTYEQELRKNEYTNTLFVNADEHTHVYEDMNQVVLWMDSIGPYENRQETYNFYSLPFCRGKNIETEHDHDSMGK